MITADSMITAKSMITGKAVTGVGAAV